MLDPAQEAEIERMARTLMAATGDVVIVTTVETFAPYGSIQEYAVKLFENHGRGIGEKGKDNGLLVVLAVKDRQVWIEVGYGLEGFITDGFSGETSRQYMIPYFRKGQYGEGLRVGVQRVIARIAQGRNVSLENVHAPSAPQSAAAVAQQRAHSVRPLRLHRHRPLQRPDRRIRRRRPAAARALGRRRLERLVRRRRRIRRRRRQLGRRLRRRRGGGGGFGGFGGGRSGGGGGGGSW